MGEGQTELRFMGDLEKILKGKKNEKGGGGIR